MQLTAELSTQMLTDPYPVYGLFRRSGEPVYAAHSTGIQGAEGMWLLSTYSQALAVLQNSTHFSKVRPRQGGLSAYEAAFDASMLFQDQAEHQRLRSLVDDLFRRTTVHRYLPLARQISRQLLADLGSGDDVNLVSCFAEPLPLLIITDLLGIPREQVDLTARLTRTIRAGADEFTISEDSYAAKTAASQELHDLFLSGLRGAWQLPEDSVMYRLQSLIGDSTLTQQQAVSMLILLSFAGQDTTTALLASSIYLLLTHPDQLSRLLSDLDLLPGAIEESLRFESPAQRSTFRLSISEYEVEGYRFQAGEQVAVLLGSANRDSSVFARADEFLIDRNPNPHLSFGSGSHHCLGRHLSVLEATTALQEFLSVFPTTTMVGEAAWDPNTFIRSLRSLPVSLGA